MRFSKDWVFSGLHLVNAKLPHHCINCSSYTLTNRTIKHSSLSVGCTSSTLLWWELRTCGSKRKEWETCWRMSSCLGIMLIASWCRTYKDYRRYIFVTVVSDEIMLKNDYLCFTQQRQKKQKTSVPAGFFAIQTLESQCWKVTGVTACLFDLGRRYSVPVQRKHGKAERQHHGQMDPVFHPVADPVLQSRDGRWD